MLQIYNTKTQRKEPLTPITPGKVTLYTCGVTVYDDCHLGHARTFIAFDVIVRYLRFRNYQVKYVRNITDIDDKIINKAKLNRETIETITTKYIEELNNDLLALQLLPPDHEPKATEFIPQMIKLVETLIANGFAYPAKNGDIYYNVRKYKNYGSLSKRNIDDLQLGARITINDAKQDPLDFVLWKTAKPNEPAWPSPWGAGRPGWHLECSAMAMHYLGETIDIHGGGFDLIFPHHENECAQSEAATGKPFVNTWMHIGFLQVNQEKMSKSLNNFHTIKEVLTTVHPEVLRFSLINAHYRSHVDYSTEQINLSTNAIRKFYLTLRDLPKVAKAEHTEFEQRFMLAMDDDFNTPEALAVLFDLTKEINKLRTTSIAQAASLAALLKYLANILGLLNCEPEQFLQHENINNNDLDVKQIEHMINLRNIARNNKDWQTADRIRTELDELGIIIEDSSNNTTWRKK